MNVAALTLFVVYLLVGFVVRTVIQYRRTGDTGWRGVSGRLGTTEWWAGIGFVVALIAGLFGPITAMAGLEPMAVFTAPVVQGAATVVAVLGIVATFATQVAMGTNWRIGVDETESTDLVTTGPFAVVRNPIFTAMAFTGAGLAVMVPNVVALTGFALLLVALELQVRVVEEPYLRRVHGADYERYEATVGRFLPGIARASAGSRAREVATEIGGGGGK